MKKNTLLVAILFIIASLTGFAQKPFIGTISYAIDCSSEEEMDPQIKMQMPTGLLIATDGNKTRIEQTSPMYSMSNIEDKKAGNGLILLDMMGQKIKIKLEKKDLDEQRAKILEQTKDQKQPVINYIEESKTIAGIKCKKAEFVDKDGNTNEFYYTNDFKVDNTIDETFTSLLTTKINGIPMEWSNTINGITIKYTVKEITTKKPKGNLFYGDDDYNEISMEEFQQMLGGEVEE